MLRGETEEVQATRSTGHCRSRRAELAEKSFSIFDTICGATQERQDALRELLDVPMDLCGRRFITVEHIPSRRWCEEKLPPILYSRFSVGFATEIKHYTYTRSGSGFAFLAAERGPLSSDHGRRILPEQFDRRNIDSPF